jgi:hypothetical protein
VASAAHKSAFNAAGERPGRDERGGGLAAAMASSKRQRTEAAPVTAPAAAAKPVAAPAAKKAKAAERAAPASYPRKCAPCRLVLRSATEWAQHVTGKKHHNRAKSTQEDNADKEEFDGGGGGGDDNGSDSLYCELCQVRRG